MGFTPADCCAHGSYSRSPSAALAADATDQTEIPPPGVCLVPTESRSGPKTAAALCWAPLGAQAKADPTRRTTAPYPAAPLSSNNIVGPDAPCTIIKAIASRGPRPSLKSTVEGAGRLPAGASAPFPSPASQQILGSVNLMLPVSITAGGSVEQREGIRSEPFPYSRSDDVQNQTHIYAQIPLLLQQQWRDSGDEDDGKIGVGALGGGAAGGGRGHDDVDPIRDACCMPSPLFNRVMAACSVAGEAAAAAADGGGTMGSPSSLRTPTGHTTCHTPGHAFSPWPLSSPLAVSGLSSLTMTWPTLTTQLKLVPNSLNTSPSTVGDPIHRSGGGAGRVGDLESEGGGVMGSVGADGSGGGAGEGGGVVGESGGRPSPQCNPVIATKYEDVPPLPIKAVRSLPLTMGGLVDDGSGGSTGRVGQQQYIAFGAPAAPNPPQNPPSSAASQQHHEISEEQRIPLADPAAYGGGGRDGGDGDLFSFATDCLILSPSSVRHHQQQGLSATLNDSVPPAIARAAEQYKEAIESHNWQDGRIRSSGGEGLRGGSSGSGGLQAVGRVSLDVMEGIRGGGEHGTWLLQPCLLLMRPKSPPHDDV